MDLFGPDLNCLACGKIHAGARVVALADGTQVSNYSEAWRIECEARSVLRIRTLEARQDRLRLIEKKRGKRAADQIKDAMLAVWNARMSDKLRAA